MVQASMKISKKCPTDVSTNIANIYKISGNNILIVNYSYEHGKWRSWQGKSKCIAIISEHYNTYRRKGTNMFRHNSIDSQIQTN